MARLHRRERSARAPRSSAATRVPEVGADPAAAPRAGAGRLRHRRRHGPHRRAGRRRRRPRCSAPLVLRDVQARAGRPYLRQRLHQHLLPAARRRGAARPRRADARGQGGQHHRRRPVHARGRRVHRGLHRGAVPPGQLPLPPPRHATTSSTSWSTTCAPAGSTTRSRPTARSPASASASRPTAAAGAVAPTGESEPVWMRHERDGRRRRRRGLDDHHRRAADHHRPLRATTTATPSTGYQATGGYAGAAQGADHDRPTQVVSTRSRTASLLGRGGAGFPAGVKWGFCPPGVWPRYLVVNGDESEPGTYKDRMLMERDPHQLIEGILIACYAVGCAQAFLYVRGEMALAQERIAAGAQRGLRRRLRRQEHPRHRLLGRHRPHLGRRRLHRRRGDRAHREPRGQPGHAPAQAAVLPGGQGPLPAAHDRQQRRDAVEPAVDHRATAATRSPRSAPRRRKGTRMFAVSGHVNKPGVFEVEYGVTTFRDLIDAPVYAGGIRDGHAAQGVHPRRRVGAVVLRGAPRPAAREAGTVDKAGSMLGSGAIVVMDETTDVVQGLPARRALLRPRVVRQVHAVPRGHDLARADPRSASSTATAGPSDLDLLLDVVRQHQPRHRLAAASRPRSARSARRPSRRSPRPSSRFRDEFEAYIGRAVQSRVGGRRVPRRAGRRCLTPTTDERPPEVDGVPSRSTATRSWPTRASCVIEAAERNGIYIPRFCYHPRMEPVGMCRMCIVEVDTGRGPALQPSCMIECTPGHEGRHRPRPVTKKAQDGVLEFLLINHPLDCPVCDKGGECPLQDQTMAYGPGESRFVEEKRHYEKPIPISDLVLPRPRALHPLRPLHPLRQGGRRRPADPLHQPGQRDRGQHLPRRAVRLVLQRQHRADLPGRRAHRRAVPVQGPPVGPRRRSSRPARRARSAAGSSSSRRRNQVLRYQGVDIDPVNWGWLCDKGRFGFEAIDSRRPPQRAAGPRAATTLADGALVATRSAEAPARSAAAIDARRARRRRRASAAPGSPTRPPTPGPSWPRASSAPTTSTPSSATACPPRSCSACRRRRSTRCAPRAAPWSCSARDLKEELPVLFLRLRARGRQPTASKVVELAPHDDRAHRAAPTVVAAPPPGRGAPTSCAALLDGARRHRRRRRRRRGDLDAARALLAATGRSRSCSAGRRWPSRPTRVVEAAARAARRARPTPASCRCCGAATSAARSTWAWRPACCPAGSTLDDGRDVVRRSAGPSVPAERGPRRRRHPRGRGRRPHRRARPARRRPAGRLPRPRPRRRVRWPAPARSIAVDHVPDRVGRSRPTSCSPPPASPRSTARRPTSRAGSAARPEGHAAGHRPGRLDDRRRAGLRLGADLGLESVDGIWAEIERLAPAHAGITRALLESPAVRRGGGAAAARGRAAAGHARADHRGPGTT